MIRISSLDASDHASGVLAALPVRRAIRASAVVWVLVVMLAGGLSGPLHAWAAPRGTDDETAVATEAELAALREDVEALRELVNDLAVQMSRTRRAVSSFRLPDSLTLAGEPVPLDRWDVAERLEREFFLALAAPAEVVLWLKRSARYFPYIEERLRAAGLPGDLKYVAVAESALRPRAYSWAHASGIWQFIPDTARRYGLRVTRAWDERRDPERSTAAATAYLKDLYAQFRDWPLALAAYNAGERRVAEALKRQGVSEYYQLVLPIETERYVFRVLAAKLILEAPDHYGFAVPAEERYAPHATDVVTVPLPSSLGVRELAAAAGSFSREIRALNPAIMSDRLPAGRYVVRVPQGGARGFAARLRSRGVSGARRDTQPARGSRPR
jgi:peptidoglycan lytic transglycosylase D